ncbi:hypothetical protein DW790_05785 [Firmicutes bacterium AM31-12AC]|nr:hypothetical protein DW790_05785 [Firmicutes bacterium AM31-12AC]
MITVVLLIMGCTVLLVADILYSEVLFGLAVTCLTVGLFMGVIFGGIAICNHIAVDKSIHETEMQYEALTKQLYLLTIQLSEYDRCYLNKEDTGYSVFVKCAGIEDENGLLSEMCADCPYLEAWPRKDKIND